MIFTSKSPITDSITIHSTPEEPFEHAFVFVESESDGGCTCLTRLDLDTARDLALHILSLLPEEGE